MAKDKMPVWVDEEAHGVLKAFAKVKKQSMVSFASDLILNQIDSLDPAAGLSGEDAPAPAPVVAAEPAAAPKAEAPKAAAPKAATTTARKAEAPKKVSKAPAKKRPAAKQTARRPRKESVPADDGTVRFLGGVWLV